MSRNFLMQKQLAMFRVERVYLYLSSTCLISSLSSNSVKVGEPSRLSFSSFSRRILSVLRASAVSAAFPAPTFWRRSISLLNSSTLSATRGAAVASELRSKARVCDSNCSFARAAVAKGFQCLPNEPSFPPPKGVVDHSTIGGFRRHGHDNKGHDGCETASKVRMRRGALQRTEIVGALSSVVSHCLVVTSLRMPKKCTMGQ